VTWARREATASADSAATPDAMSSAGPAGLSKAQWAAIAGAAAASALALWYLTKDEDASDEPVKSSGSSGSSSPSASPARATPPAAATAAAGVSGASAGASSAPATGSESPAAAPAPAAATGGSSGGAGGASSAAVEDAASSAAPAKNDAPAAAPAEAAAAPADASGEGAGEEGEEGAGAVSREMLISLLQKIVVGAQSILVQLANTQGDASQEELSQTFLAQVQEYEKQIYADAGVSGGEVEAATERYATDERVHALGTQLHKLCTAISQPTQLPPVPESLDADAFVKAFKGYMETVNKCFDDALKKALDSGCTGRELLTMVNTEVMSPAAQERQEAVLRNYGLTEPVFQAALHKYQELEAVKVLLEALQRHQQEQLQRVLGAGPSA